MRERDPPLTLCCDAGAAMQLIAEQLAELVGLRARRDHLLAAIPRDLLPAVAPPAARSACSAVEPERRGALRDRRGRRRRGRAAVRARPCPRAPRGPALPRAVHPGRRLLAACRSSGACSTSRTPATASTSTRTRRTCAASRRTTDSCAQKRARSRLGLSRQTRRRSTALRTLRYRNSDMSAGFWAEAIDAEREDELFVEMDRRARGACRTRRSCARSTATSTAFATGDRPADRALRRAAPGVPSALFVLTMRNATLVAVSVQADAADHEERRSSATAAAYGPQLARAHVPQAARRARARTRARPCFGAARARPRRLSETRAAPGTLSTTSGC